MTCERILHVAQWFLNCAAYWIRVREIFNSTLMLASTCRCSHLIVKGFLSGGRGAGLSHPDNLVSLACTFIVTSQ